MLVKNHVTEDGRLILAVCDSNLIGKKFEEGIAQLDLTGEFYKGEEMPAVEVADLMRNAFSLNLIGLESVKTALDEELISPDQVRYVQKIPYAMAVANNI